MLPALYVAVSSMRSWIAHLHSLYLLSKMPAKRVTPLYFFFFPSWPSVSPPFQTLSWAKHLLASHLFCRCESGMRGICERANKHIFLKCQAVLLFAATTASTLLGRLSVTRSVNLVAQICLWGQPLMLADTALARALLIYPKGFSAGGRVKLLHTSAKFVLKALNCAWSC